MDWPTIDADIQAFVEYCLVYILTSSGKKVPCLLGQQIQAEKVEELPHLDYLYVAEPWEGSEYILILKDDFSGYVYLRHCNQATNSNAAEVILEYFSTFVYALRWFLCRCPIFCGEVIGALSLSLGAKHRFSIAYAPWSNGTVNYGCEKRH